MNRRALISALRRAVSHVSPMGEKTVGKNLTLHHGRGGGQFSRQYISDVKGGGEVRTEISGALLGRKRHPEINFDLYGPASEATGRKAVSVGRDAMRNVTAAIKRDAKVHRPSAYTYFPTSDSRAKLYASELKRAGVPYSLTKQRGRFGETSYKLVYDPGVLSDIVQGLASTAPLAGLAAAAYSQQPQNPIDEEFR